MPTRKVKHENKNKKRKARPATNKRTRNVNSPGTSRTASLPIKNQNQNTVKNNGQRVSGINKISKCASGINKRSFKVTNHTMPTVKSTYKSPGLSPKEKSFLYNLCQPKFHRYIALKNLAMTAMKQNKIFIIYGQCKAVQKALLDRGWVEKFPLNRMNLLRIQKENSSSPQFQEELEKLLLANFVERHIPNFIWCSGDENKESTIDMMNNCNTIINRLKIDALWTTKQGLCTSMKSSYWYYIEDISDVNSPRTYSADEGSELDEFVHDFKMTACTSLLKWILSMVANERQIFTEEGTVSIKIFIFAMNRCKQYLMEKQHRDVDVNLASVKNSQWETFLTNYYNIIERGDVFQLENEEKSLSLYLCYTKFLLKEMFAYRPQLSCEGCSNIWIVKPAHCSRGRGIRMAAKLNLITDFLKKANTKYVVQKYIEDPLIIYDTKFDIRQYYLVTNTCPLTIWMYKDCYLKFSSQKYTLKNFHESVHLTNNCIQKHYRNCAERHPDLPIYNMWDLDTYKEYLNKIGKSDVWENIIYPGMKKCIIGIMLSCQDALYSCKNRFELYGCDFVLDKDFKPWLIEINSRPDLNSTTKVTGKICTDVILDIIKVVIDFANNRLASTGKFECIYKQPVTVPQYGNVTDLAVHGASLPANYFYQGEILIEVTCDDPFLGKEFNSDTDIMIEPEKVETYEALTVQNDENEQTEFDNCTVEPNSVSSEELNIEAAAINRQLEEIIQRIPSESSFDSKTSCKRDPYTCLPVARSATTLNTLQSSEIKELGYKSRSQMVFPGRCHTFSYSQIGDETQKIENFTSGFTAATHRMMSFIKEKEKEYVRDLCFSLR